MSSNLPSAFQPLVPGVKLEDDWCNFPIPTNMEVGENTVIDSSSTFKKYFSKKTLGLKLGKHVTLQSSSLATESQGYIEIGDYCYISGAAIIACEKVIIGNYVFIAGGVTIVDSDFHPLDPGERLEDTIIISTVGKKKQRPAFAIEPVIIEDDVWIGYNATILKGVTIGQGAIIQPGAVVIRDIPAGAIVSGNPAQIEQNEYA